MIDSGEEQASGLHYGESRQFLIAESVFARGLPTLPFAPRPKRNTRAAAFVSRGGNTTPDIHLSEVPPGGTRQGHRHLGEATLYVVSGHAWSESPHSDHKPD